MVQKIEFDINITLAQKGKRDMSMFLIRYGGLAVRRGGLVWIGNHDQYPYELSLYD